MLILSGLDDKYGQFFDEYKPGSKTKQTFVSRGQKRKKRKNRFTKYIVSAVIAVLVVVIVILSVPGIPDNTLDTENGHNAAAIAVENVSSVTGIADKTTPFPKATRCESTVTLGNKIQSNYGVLVDLSDNTILAEKSPDTRIYPASMTKIMTLLVAAENVDSITKTFRMTQLIIDPLYKDNCSMSGFCAGEDVKIVDLFYGTALVSGAESAVGLANYVAGSEKAFVEMMNSKATALGLTSTHFTNVIGLHNENHYTTCNEMAIILEAAINNDFCRKLLSTEFYTVAANSYHDEILFHSTMFSRMHGTEPEVATILGGKTGYTVNSSNCLASFAKTDDERTIICVTADGGGKYIPIYDCIEMYKKYTHPIK